MVVKRGVNEHSVLPMARHFRERGHILRFIEYMDVGTPTAGAWTTSSRARDRVDMIAPRCRSSRRPQLPGEVAERWRYRDGSGEIGVIASVTQAFCRDCTRAAPVGRGQLYTCLFATAGHDLRGAAARRRERRRDRATIAASGRGAPTATPRSAARTVPLKKIEMSYIGG
jgi:GTP 3',8-cyclase